MLEALPLIFVLIGLALYGVLGGADFGAGFWQLVSGSGRHGNAIRQFAHDSMAPVWEANHVWLIFVLTVTWTCYPVFFGSFASTLCIPLLIAGVGIIFRGASYALRTAASSAPQERTIDAAFGVSSLIVPFTLGAAVGAIAGGRVPVGNAAGPLFSSWLNPTSILIGVLAVATGAYLAAVFMSGDAVRRGAPELAEAFRRRALVMGVLAGGIAVGGLVILHADDHRLYEGLVSGWGLVPSLISVLAGMGTLAFVAARRLELARYCAPVAVVAIIAGWAVAQSPRLLPGLTVDQAAAGHDTLVSAVVAVVAGGALLLPALVTLFRLTLGGQLSAEEVEMEEEAPQRGGASAHKDHAPGLTSAAPHTALLIRVAAALLVIGIGLTNVADAEWAHIVGAVALLGFVGAGFLSLIPARAVT